MSRPTVSIKRLDEIDDVFARTHDKEGRADIRCDYCKGKLPRATRERARRWFIEHTCQKTERLRRKPLADWVAWPLTKVRLADILPPHLVTADLTERPSTEESGEMNPEGPAIHRCNHCGANAYFAVRQQQLHNGVERASKWLCPLHKRIHLIQQRRLGAAAEVHTGLRSVSRTRARARALVEVERVLEAA